MMFMCWALIVATGAGTNGSFSGEFLMRAGLSLDGRVFRYFPPGVVMKVVVVIG